LQTRCHHSAVNVLKAISVTGRQQMAPPVLLLFAKSLFSVTKLVQSFDKTFDDYITVGHHGPETDNKCRSFSYFSSHKASQAILP